MGGAAVKHGHPVRTRAEPVTLELTEPYTAIPVTARPTSRSRRWASRFDARSFVRRVLVARIVLGVIGMVMLLAPIEGKVYCALAAGMAIVSSLVFLRVVGSSPRLVAAWVGVLDAIGLGAIASLGGLDEVRPLLLWPVVLAAFVIGSRWALWAGLAVGVGLSVSDIVIGAEAIRFDTLVGNSVLFGSLGWLLGRFGEHHERTSAHAADYAQRYEEILASAPDAIVMCDPDMRVVECNPPAAELFEWQVGSRLGIGERTGDPTVEDRIREQLEAGGTFGPAELWFGCTEHPAAASVSVSVLTGPKGEVRGYVAVVRDVTTQRRQERHFRRLSEAARKIATLGDSDAVVDAFLQLAMDLTEADSAAFVRVSDEHCEIVASHGLPPWLDRYRYPVLRGVASRVAHEGRPMITNDYASSPDAHPMLRALGVNATMDVPLPRVTQVPAVLSVARKAGRGPFGETDVQVLAALAGHAAVALQKAEALDQERRLREDAEQASAVKDTVIATVSHELRTPLTSLLGFVQTLRRHGDTIDDELRSDLLERACTQGERLRRLIEQALSLAEGGEGPRVRATELEPVIRTAVGERTCRIDLTDLVVLADPDHLEIALRNLVENAAKHGDADTIEVRVCAEDGAAEISVSDRGSGVPEADRERLFERFVRGSRAEGVPGLGVGLALVREHVEAMGGSVRHEHVLPSGARFVVRLPLAPVPTVGTGR